MLNRSILYVGNIGDDIQNSTKHWQSIHKFSKNANLVNLVDLNFRRWWLKFFFLDPFSKKILDIASNRILKAVIEFKPDIIWFEKPLLVDYHTLVKIKKINPFSFLVCRQDDNPFGLRSYERSFWKNFIAAIPYYDLHFVKRDIDFANFSKHGAKNLSFFWTGYDSKHFYFPIDGLPRKDLLFSFIGGNFDNRSKFLSQLQSILNSENFYISGDRWNRSLLFYKFPNSVHNGQISDLELSNIYQRSFACLGLFSTSNQDEFSGRAFQIAGCGSVLVAPRSPVHSSLFIEGKEALFFDSVEECASIILRLASNVNYANSVGLSASIRSSTNGYSLDDRVLAALKEIDNIIKLRSDNISPVIE